MRGEERAGNWTIFSKASEEVVIRAVKDLTVGCSALKNPSSQIRASRFTLKKKNRGYVAVKPTKLRLIILEGNAFPPRFSNLLISRIAAHLPGRTPPIAGGGSARTRARILSAEYPKRQLRNRRLRVFITAAVPFLKSLSPHYPTDVLQKEENEPKDRVGLNAFPSGLKIVKVVDSYLTCDRESAMERLRRYPCSPYGSRPSRTGVERHCGHSRRWFRSCRAWGGEWIRQKRSYLWTTAGQGG